MAKKDNDKKEGRWGSYGNTMKPKLSPKKKAEIEELKKELKSGKKGKK